MGKCKKSGSAIEEDPGGGNNEIEKSKKEILIDENWHAAYKNSLRSVDDLAQYLALNKTEKTSLTQVLRNYHMRIPAYYFSLIKNITDQNDPVRKQCIPSVDEIREEIHETIDPLGEEKTSPSSCLVHRYPDRVLLLVTGKCFMYCRHCTRKRLWKSKTSEPTLGDIDEALQYVTKNSHIREVIVSGGDPLTLSTERIDYILSSLSGIKNIEVIRIGTRAPVVLPQRVDDDLCAALGKYKNLWINVQFNHPAEITAESAYACRKLQKCGIPMSNQSVLLKGINDDSRVMLELCHKLQEIRVRPYYLFQCDPVVGASHFRTPVWKGVDIIEKMRGHTSGMCVPTFVVDGIDGKGKVPLGPDYLVSRLDDGVILRNYNHELFYYHSPKDDENVRVSAMKKSKVPSIGIAFNLKRDHEDDKFEEYDEIETIESLKKEIEALGFDVLLFEQDDNFLKNITEKKPDFVLNIAEGIGTTRGRESQVPAVLESLGIPYSGSDPIALGVTLDKYLTHCVLKSAGIPVPEMFMVKDSQEVVKLKNIFETKKMYVVKPRWEGSSKGIFLNSVVDNFQDLKERVHEILDQYHQPALVEEFLENDEITVGVYGNNGVASVLGMMKIVPQQKSQKIFIYSIETKRDWQNKVKYEPQNKIPSSVQTKITQAVLAAFEALEIRDIARIDFRLDSHDNPKIIDVNLLPGLSPRYSDLPILYRLNGGAYPELIKTILQESFKRYGLPWLV